jgi:hypothetical protein
VLSPSTHIHSATAHVTNRGIAFTIIVNPCTPWQQYPKAARILHMQLCCAKTLCHPLPPATVIDCTGARAEHFFYFFLQEV